MSRSFSNTATILADARKTRRKIFTLPDCAPKNLSDAYDIQDRLIAEMRLPVAGWKVGATGQAGMNALNVTEPVAGPIFATVVHRSPAEIAAPDAATFIVEAEFAFQMGQDLLPQDGPFRRSEILGSVAGLFPAIEIVDTRFEKGFAVGGFWVVADGCANHAFVHGQLIDGWRKLNFSELSVRVLVNGKLKTSGTGSAVLGGPVFVLEWLVNHLCWRGIALNAGDWVSTGLLTEVISIRPGDICVADFGSLGFVKIARSQNIETIPNDSGEPF